MDIIYSDEIPRFDRPSIFLAGPTYRNGDKVVEGSFWRIDAISILSSLGYKGTVFVPELSKPVENFDYTNQVEWEFECLEGATTIIFWVPRDKHNLIGLTTNVEFGRYIGSGKALYGRPDDAYCTRYLDFLYYKVTKQQPQNSLKLLLQLATERQL
jgi:hypothetical protein